MSPDRPNVLLLIQDQLRYDVVHDPHLCRTPALDRLRADGISFRRAYTTAGICSPARGSLLTGLYPHAHGVLNNIHGKDAIVRDLPREHVTVAEVLREAGYRTGYVGKWHVGMRDGPQERGFADTRATDEYLETAEALEPYRSRLSERARDAVFTRYAPHIARIAGRFRRTPFPLYATEPLPENALPAHAVSEQASALLGEYAKDPRPFFLVVSFVEPHWPNVLPPRYASMYDPASIGPWANFDDPFVNKPRTNAAGLEHFGVGDFTWEDWQPVVARYLGAVSFVDDLVGRLLATLEEKGLEADTFVIVTADHGDMTGSHRQFNKGPVMYEEVYRVPLVVRAPGVAAGTTAEGLASHIDLFPTLLDLAGVAPVGRCQGRSLVPVLRGEARGWRQALMCEFHGDEFGLYSQRMLRWHDYKLVYNPNDARELYDLEGDPFELRNLAYEDRYSELRRDLEGRLLELMDETEDPLSEWAVNTLG